MEIYTKKANQSFPVSKNPFDKVKISYFTVLLFLLYTKNKI